MYKSLRLISIICFLSLTSNLVGNFVWTCAQQKESINLSLEEDDTEEPGSSSDPQKNKGGGKKAINVLEEELHLATHDHLSSFDIDFKPVSSSTFSVITDKTNSSKKAPLDNPPEIVTEFS